MLRGSKSEVNVSVLPENPPEVDTLVHKLHRSICSIVNAVGGDEPPSCLGISYQRFESGPEEVLHMFHVHVSNHVMGAILGREGEHARHIRQLIKVRARTCGSRDRLDIHFVRSRQDFPTSATVLS